VVLLGFFGPQSLVSSSSFLKLWQLEAAEAEAVIPEDHPVVVFRAVAVHREAGN
jgi:hypothetical protein